jgi:hypothetical protein
VIPKSVLSLSRCTTSFVNSQQEGLIREEAGIHVAATLRLRPQASTLFGE